MSVVKIRTGSPGSGIRSKHFTHSMSGVFGLEDSTEQGPVDGPSLDGFAFVGAVAVDALLADMQLPASEIGWCGFHGVGVWLVRL